jgi:hypothetical protein
MEGMDVPKSNREEPDLATMWKTAWAASEETVKALAAAFKAEETVRAVKGRKAVVAAKAAKAEAWAKTATAAQVAKEAWETAVAADAEAVAEGGEFAEVAKFLEVMWGGALPLAHARVAAAAARRPMAMAREAVKAVAACIGGLAIWLLFLAAAAALGSLINWTVPGPLRVWAMRALIMAPFVVGVGWATVASLRAERNWRSGIRLDFSDLEETIPSDRAKAEHDV